MELKSAPFIINTAVDFLVLDNEEAALESYLQAYGACYVLDQDVDSLLHDAFKTFVEQGVVEDNDGTKLKVIYQTLKEAEFAWDLAKQDLLTIE